jgi:hypothetical protein
MYIYSIYLSVCVCVCVCVCVYVYMCVCVYIYILRYILYIYIRAGPIGQQDPRHRQLHYGAHVCEPQVSRCCSKAVVKQ